MPGIQIAVINACTVLTDNQVSAAVPDLQKQVSRDFAPIWGSDATLTFVPSGRQPPPAGSWWLTIFDNSDQAGALGYHNLTSEGLPLGKVFAGSDLRSGYQWTVTTSHELLEMLADPDINLTVFVQADQSSGIIYSHEICDACEADRYGYAIDGTQVSDFVYPEWFEAFRATFQLLSGGYISVYDVIAGTGWQQVTATAGPLNALDTVALTRALSVRASYTYDMRPRIGSRRERRRTRRSQWLRSMPKQLAATPAAPPK